MIRAEFGVAAIAFVATVTALNVIKECCTSAQAETQSASPEPTFWDHNGSVIYLVANGSSREFYYQKPRAGMLEVGARPGSLLFRGEIDNGQYSGTAYIFNPHCGQIPFQVKGPALANDERIVLTGQAPRVGQNCRTHESSTTNLEFRQLKPNPNEAAHSQEQFTAAPEPIMEESKPKVPSTDGGELPSVPTARSSTHAGSASQGTSVYVAGKGKYCKETTMSGYLDCFYASLDACEKHNKSANVRCVANPNPGS
jgi:hypothetical protein